VPGDPNDPASNEICLGGGDGALIVGEMDVPMITPGRLWAGYWRYTADFDRPFGTGRANDNDGWYIGTERGFELGDYAASAFLRYGQADDDLNALRDYLGAGFIIDAPLVGRPDDRLGIAVASVGAGDPYRAFLDQSGAGSDARETAWELTYRAPINEHIAIQPNVQWVSNPSASDEIDDTLIIGVRFEIAN